MESEYFALFQATLSGVKLERQNAEAALNALSANNPEAGVHLFNFAVSRTPSPDPQNPNPLAYGNGQLEIACRLAGATRLKNLVARSSWKRTHHFTAEGKQYVMENIVPRLCDPGLEYRIHRLLLVCLEAIVSYEWPSNWPQLLPQLYQAMDSALATTPNSEVEAKQQIVAIRTCCLAIRICGRRACGITDGSIADDKLADAVADQALPRLCRVLALVSGSTASQAVFECQHVALKALRVFFEQRLPLTLCEPNAFDSFYNSLLVMTTTTQTQLQAYCQDQSIYSRLSTEEGIQSDTVLAPFFKVLKWIWATHHSVLSEFCVPKFVAKKARKSANLFVEKYATALYEKALELVAMHDGIQAPSTGSKLCTKSFLNAVDFIFCGVTTPGLKPIVLGTAQQLLGQHLIPRLAVTAEDINLWQIDPEEYVRQQNSVSIDYGGPKKICNYVVSELLDLLAQEQNPLLGQLLSHVDARLRANENALEVDGLLFLLIHTQKKASLHCFPRDRMEGVLISVVAPQLQSPHGFLRAKALQCLAHYVRKVPWSSPAVLQNMTGGVLGLLEDKELPVRLQAAASFRPFVLHRGNHELIQPRVVEIVKSYLHVMSQMDNAATIETLRVLIQRYGATLSQWAVELAKVLIQHFTKIQTSSAKTIEAGLEGVTAWDGKKGNEAGEGDELSAALDAADELCSALIALIEAVPKDTGGDTLVALQEALNAFFYAMLSHSSEHMGCMDGVVEVLATLIQRSPAIHPATWNLFPALHQVLTGGALDYFGEVLSVIDNMVSVEPKSFFMFPDPTSGQPGYLPGILSSMVRHSFESEADLSDRALSSAAKAVDLVNLATRPAELRNSAMVGPVVGQLVQPALATLGKRTSCQQSFRVLLANCILSGLSAHSMATLEVLHRNNCVMYFAQSYSQLVRSGAVELRLYDRQLFLVAFISLLELAVEQGNMTFFESIGLTGPVLQEWLNDATAFVQKNSTEYKKRVELKLKKDAKKANKTAGGGGEDDDDDDDNEWADEETEPDSDFEDDDLQFGDDEEGGDDEEEGDDDELFNDDTIQALASQARALAQNEDANDGLGEDNLLDEVDLVTPIDSEDTALQLFNALQVLQSRQHPLWANLQGQASQGLQALLSEASGAFSAAKSHNLQ